MSDSVTVRVEPGQARLERGALRVLDVAVATVANIAPTFGVLFVFTALAVEAGAGFGWPILVAGLGIVLLGNTLAEFSRSRPSAGSFLTLIGRGFGPWGGAAATVVSLAGQVIALASVMAISGEFIRLVMDRYLGLNPPWEAVTVVLVLAVAGFVLTGVRIAARLAVGFLIFEVALLAVVSVALVAANSSAVSADFIRPGQVSGAHGFGLGFVLAVFLFIGWENSGAMAEETADPRRNVPRAIFGGILTTLVVYLLTGFAFATGASAYPETLEQPLPFIAMADRTSGVLEPLLYLSGLSSAVAILIAALNSQARMFFSAAREGLLPAGIARLNRRRVPVVAVLLLTGLDIAGMLVFGSGRDPYQFFAKASTLGTLLVIYVYIAATVALPFYFRRDDPAGFNVARHLVVPVLALATLGYPLYMLLKPGQPAPYDTFGWVSGCVVLAAFGYAAVLAARVPHLSDRIGSIVADRD